MLDTIISWLENALNWVLSCLPDSPFQALSNSVISEYLPLINWLFPFSFVIETLQLWLVAISIYYIYSAVLRWVKAVQ